MFESQLEIDPHIRNSKNTWIEDYAQRVIDTKTTLDVIDSEGSFESDDEIGTVFQGIKDTVNELTDITNQEI